LQSHDSASFVFSLDLLPEEIFGTEEVPEYIPSDSSAEEEDATLEQKANHQLRCRIRHLEHNLRDITVGGYPKNSDNYPNMSMSSQHVQVQN
jgi:hypothetical protein